MNAAVFLPCRLVVFAVPSARPPAGLDPGRFSVFSDGHGVYRAFSNPLFQVRDEAPHHVPGGQQCRGTGVLIYVCSVFPTAVVSVLFDLPLDSVSVVHASARLVNRRDIHSDYSRSNVSPIIVLARSGICTRAIRHCMCAIRHCMRASKRTRSCAQPVC